VYLRYTIYILIAWCFGSIIRIPDEYAAIQEGIDFAEIGDTVLVSQGYYWENLDFNGKDIVVTSYYYSSQDTLDLINTIINGNSEGNTVKLSSGETSNAILQGFSIQNGFSSSYYEPGGGVSISNGSSPTIRDLIITGNVCRYGGGLGVQSANPKISDITIYGNSTVDFQGYNYGGGVYLEAVTSGLLTNVKIYDNESFIGGGIYILNSSIEISGIQLRNNTAFAGGGIYCEYSNPVFTRMTVMHNIGALGSGLHVRNYSNPIIQNSVFYGNNVGNGIFCSNNSHPILVNSILWENTDIPIRFDEAQWSNSITIAYSDLQGGYESILTNDNGEINWLSGNIDVDPSFVSQETGDFYLTHFSPCIDSGIDYLIENEDTLINLSNDEYSGNAPDMGVFEFTAYDGVFGDINQDFQIDILDIVQIVQFILGNEIPTGYQLWAADFNLDSIVNVQDIIQILNLILNT